jgi:uncharacterized membrane protein YukC
MKTFRVFGRKFQDYWVEVDAKDEYQAIDIANSLESHKWNKMDIDDIIEATDVYLNDDTSDEYPSMESGIIVGGK